MNYFILTISTFFITQVAFAEISCKNIAAKLCPSPANTPSHLSCLLAKRDSLPKPCKGYIYKLALNFQPCILETLEFCQTSKELNTQTNFKCLNLHTAKSTKRCLEFLANAEKNGEQRVASIIDEIASGCADEYQKCGPPEIKKSRECVQQMYMQKKVSNKCKNAIEKVFKKK